MSLWLLQEVQAPGTDACLVSGDVNGRTAGMVEHS